MIRQMTHGFGCVRRDQGGATLVEFALIAPFFLGIVMFIFDAGYMAYARALLSGEVNAVGRASALETATDVTRGTMDAQLEERLQQLVPHGEVEFGRLAFTDYGRAQARAEPFADVDGSNACDNGESFVDLNGNGRYDLDGGRTGGGGARDVVIYTVTLRYDRIFPVAGLLGLDNEVVLRSQTLLKNQPFDLQSQPITRTCA